MVVLSTNKFYSYLLTAIGLYYPELIDPALKPRDVPQKEVRDTYDFVIVGGGIAGCVLARRLTEVPDWTVLLMEAGGDETPESSPPFLFVDLKKTELVWNFTSVPQKRACLDNNGVCVYPFGKGLGGTSIVFSMVHSRGSPKDYRNNAVKYNIPKWNEKIVLKYFIKLENATGLNRPDFKYRGYKGPLQVAYPRYIPRLQKEYIKAGKELGWVLRDYNGPIVDNTVAYPQLTVDGPSRQSAAKAYLYPIRNRKNLAIIKYSFAIKILVNKKRRAIGVEYFRGGRKYRVKARKEVLLTAGVFNSPKLLMLSGIGPKKELKKHGIKVIENLPVGKNLQDQVGIPMYFELDKNVTITPDIWKTKDAIHQFTKYKRGPLTSNGIGAIAFNGKEDSPNPPTVSFLFYYRFESQIIAEEEANGRQVVVVLVSLLHSKSRGYVTLRSTDPFDPPVIDPKYLSYKEDYDNLRSGIGTVFKFMRTKVMRKYSPKLYTDQQPKCKNLNELEFTECLMKNYAVTQYRAVGTTRLGGEELSSTVLNTKLLVKNLKKLRVVGSLISPGQATGFPFGTSYFSAEYLSDIIKSDYLSTSTGYSAFEQMVHQMLHNNKNSSKT